MSNQNKIHIFANWKMYLNLAESVAVAKELKSSLGDLNNNTNIVIFPSSLALAEVKNELSGTNVKVGAQNVYWVEKGGTTGETSAEMFKEAGAEFALVGHSERRHLFKETNSEVRKKLAACLDSSLTPVLCVGETKEERRKGLSEEVVEAQLRGALADVSWPDEVELIVAYEPVWAIGTGNPSSPVDAEKMARLTSRLLKGLVPNAASTIVYGGSVKQNNVETYIGEPHISGVLVGAASTNASSFIEITHSARQ